MQKLFDLQSLYQSYLNRIFLSGWTGIGNDFVNRKAFADIIYYFIVANICTLTPIYKSNTPNLFSLWLWWKRKCWHSVWSMHKEMHMSPECRWSEVQQLHKRILEYSKWKGLCWWVYLRWKILNLTSRSCLSVHYTIIIILISVIKLKYVNHYFTPNRMQMLRSGKFIGCVQSR